jgi:hypothetical protein
MSDYLVPFGVDSSKFFSGIQGMENRADQAVTNLQTAGKDMSNALSTATTGADKLADGLKKDVDAAKLLSDQAKKAGQDIASSLSGNGIDQRFKSKVDAIKKQLASLTSISFNIKGDVDTAVVSEIEKQIKSAATATDAFNVVIESAKKQLSEMQPGGQNFVTLKNQIQDAEELVEFLTKAMQSSIPVSEQAGAAFDSAFDNASALLSADQVKELDKAIESSSNEAGILKAQVTAVAQALKGAAPGTQAYRQLEQTLAAGNAALAVYGEKVVSVADAEQAVEEKSISLAVQLRAVREELGQMSLAGEEDTEKFAELTEQAERLGTAISNTNQRIRAVSSSTKTLDAGIQGVQALAGAFATAQGIVGLFGVENEKSQIIIQRVTASLAILQGVQALANALNSDSALGILLLNKLRIGSTAAIAAETTATEALVVAEGEAIVATEGVAAAEGAATVATEGFTAALLLNPIALIVVAILAAATALVLYASTSSEAERAVESMNEELEHQKSLLDINISTIQRNTNLQVALAQQRGAKESEVSKLEIKSLQDQQKARDEFSAKIANANVELYRQLQKGEIDNETYAKAHDKNVQDQLAADEAYLQAQNDIGVKGINLQAQFNKESRELLQARLTEETNAYNARKALLTAGLALINNARDEEVKAIVDANERAKQQTRNAAADRIEALKQSIKDMREAAKENSGNIQLTQIDIQQGNIDPQAGARRIQSLNEQNALLAANQKKANANIVAIRKGLQVDLNKVDQDAIIKRIDLQLSANEALANAMNDGEEKELALARASFQKQRNEIKTQYANEKELREQLLAANQATYIRKTAQISQEYILKRVDQETEGQVLLVELSEKFTANSTKAEERRQVAILEVQLKGAQKRLAAMVDDGTAESKLAILQQQKLIKDLKKNLVDAKSQAGTVDIFDIIGLGGLNDKQKDALKETAQLALSAVHQITQGIIDDYSRQIDAKQAVINADEENLKSLEDQLDREKELRDKGLANNYDAIQKQVADKKKQIDEEKKQQAQLLRDRAAAQKAQLALDTAAEASGLIVSAVNIFKGFTAAFPIIGVPLAIAAIGAMTGGFIAAKVAAFKAVNDSAKQFGEGGWIDGKSHSQGGVKYIAADGGTGPELEGNEFVVNAERAQKHSKFIEAFNKGRVTHDALYTILQELGIPLMSEKPKELLIKTQQVEEAKLHVVHIAENGDNANLKDINSNIAFMANQQRNRVETWEDDKFYYFKSGTKLKKVRK